MCGTRRRALPVVSESDRGRGSLSSPPPVPRASIPVTSRRRSTPPGFLSRCAHALVRRCRPLHFRQPPRRHFHSAHTGKDRNLIVRRSLPPLSLHACRLLPPAPRYSSLPRSPLCRRGARCRLVSRRLAAARCFLAARRRAAHARACVCVLLCRVEIAELSWFDVCVAACSASILDTGNSASLNAVENSAWQSVSRQISSQGRPNAYAGLGFDVDRVHGPFTSLGEDAHGPSTVWLRTRRVGKTSNRVRELCGTCCAARWRCVARLHGSAEHIAGA